MEEPANALPYFLLFPVILGDTLYLQRHHLCVHVVI